MEVGAGHPPSPKDSSRSKTQKHLCPTTGIQGRNSQCNLVPSHSYSAILGHRFSPLESFCLWDIGYLWHTWSFSSALYKSSLIKLEVWRKSLLNQLQEEIPLPIWILLLISNLSRHFNVYSQNVVRVSTAWTHQDSDFGILLSQLNFRVRFWYLFYVRSYPMVLSSQ